MNKEEFQLRPICEKDLETVLSWRNSDRIRENMYSDHVISWEEHVAWFRRVDVAEPATVMVFEHSGRQLGLMNLSQMDKENNSCHWGFYIGDPDAPRGSGTIMAYFALEYIFEKVGIRKLIGEALGFNKGSIAYHQKLGFVEEGRFLKHVLKNGVYEDVCSFALFQDQWLINKIRLEAKCFAITGDAQ